MVMALFSIFIGRISDNKVLSSGVFPFSISWIFRLFFISGMGIFFMNVFASFSSIMIEIPFYRMIYGDAKTSYNIANYFLLREINLSISKAIILIPLILTGNILIPFIIAFFASFFYLFLVRE